MNRIATQATSLSLAALITLCTLVGLNALASTQHVAPQQAAAAVAPTA